jgi:hypothetical protein
VLFLLKLMKGQKNKSIFENLGGKQRAHVAHQRQEQSIEKGREAKGGGRAAAAPRRFLTNL